MNRFSIVIIVLFSISIGQDSLFTINGSYSGKLIEVKENSIKFWPSPLPGKITSKLQEYPKTEVIRVMDDGQIIFENFNQDSLRTVNCEENKTVKMLIMPIAHDSYGLTEEIVDFYSKQCFSIITNLDALEELFNSRELLSEVNDFTLLRIGSFLNLDKIVYGYTFSITKSLNYESTGLANNLPMTTSIQSINDLLNFLPNAIYELGEEKRRNMAMNEAGTYILLTLYAIDIKTKSKNYILKNTAVLKF